MDVYCKEELDVQLPRIRTKTAYKVFVCKICDCAKSVFSILKILLFFGKLAVKKEEKANEDRIP